MLEDECKKATHLSGRKYIKQLHMYVNYPPGCFVLGEVFTYFNTVNSGLGNKEAKSICKQGIIIFLSCNKSIDIIHVTNIM